MSYFPGGSYHVEIPETVSGNEETDMSLITGRLRRVGQGDNSVETGTAVVLRNDNMALASQADTASKYNKI